MNAAEPVAPQRRRRLPGWLAALITVAATMLVVSVVVGVYLRLAAWPPFVCAADAMGNVLGRDGHLPPGAEWRGTGKAWALSVFGVDDPAARQRIADAARAELRQRGRCNGYDSLEIEFWSGDAPPRGTNTDTEPDVPGRACVETIRVP